MPPAELGQLPEDAEGLVNVPIREIAALGSKRPDAQDEALSLDSSEGRGEAGGKGVGRWRDMDSRTSGGSLIDGGGSGGGGGPPPVARIEFLDDRAAPAVRPASAVGVRSSPGAHAARAGWGKAVRPGTAPAQRAAYVIQARPASAIQELHYHDPVATLAGSQPSDGTALLEGVPPNGARTQLDPLPLDG